MATNHYRPNRGKFETELIEYTGNRRRIALNSLRVFAIDHPGPLGQAAAELADRFVGCGEPYCVIDGMDMYDFTGPERALLRAAIHHFNKQGGNS